MGLTAAQKAALAAKKKAAAAAAAAAKKNPAPAPAPAKPKATPSPAPAPIDAPRNPLNVPFSQRLNAALKAAGATDAQIAAADTIMEKDALLRSLKNPVESNLTGDPDIDPVSTPAELGPVPKKKGKGRGKKDDAPAPIEEDDAEAEDEPKPKKKGRSTKGQPRAKDGKYNMPEGPLPEAVKPAAKPAKAATNKRKKPVSDENLDAEEEVSTTTNKVSGGLGSYLPGAQDPFLKPVYGAIKYAYQRPVQSTLLAYLAAQALSGLSPKEQAQTAPAQGTSQPPAEPYMTDIDMPGVTQKREDMPMRGQPIPQEEMAEGMEQDGERRFFFEKPANPAGGPTDIIRQYRQR